MKITSRVLVFLKVMFTILVNYKSQVHRILELTAGDISLWLSTFTRQVLVDCRYKTRFRVIISSFCRHVPVYSFKSISHFNYYQIERKLERFFFCLQHNQDFSVMLEKKKSSLIFPGRPILFSIHKKKVEEKKISGPHGNPGIVTKISQVVNLSRESICIVV